MAQLPFHEPVRDWFARSFGAPTRAQELAWPLIRSGESALILAPTGSGKTLAAFLSAIDRLLFEPVPERKERCRVLYISPLKALAVDVERNLRAPLVGVAHSAERLGAPYNLPEIALRTGDTPARERTQFASRPADILITTPESLYLLLTTQARATLRSVRCVIIDELHALIATKRGAHLALSLERLEQLLPPGARLQRIGLSATLHPIDEAARFLGGLTQEDGALRPRPVRVADAREKKRLELAVEVPVEDMARPKAPEDEIRSGPAAAGGDKGSDRLSIWPAMHPLLLDLIRSHRSTLIFVNSRRLSERLAGALNELAGAEIVKAHHGSIARAQRSQIEDDLKAGKLPALVATSSLELGIDMGAIDLVVQVEAPPSVASGLQRVGRAGHHLGAASEGVILPKYRGDLLACAALCARMLDGAVEALRYPRSPLDVLCQQLVAMTAVDDWTVDELFACAQRAAPFAELSRPIFESVLDLLSGRYPSDEFAELRPRLTWDRLQGTLKGRAGGRQVAIISGGTIPDRGYFGVYLSSAVAGAGEGGRGRPTSGRVGELDEEMVFESRPGETFILGASTWRIDEITHDKVLVSPAPGEPGKMPFWRGEQAGRPLEFGRAIGALSRTLRELPRADALALLTGRHCLTARAAENLLTYLEEQGREGGGAVPDDRTIVAERHLDELGDHRLCLLSPFGSQVHGPLALCMEALIRQRAGPDSEVQLDLLWTDDGIILRFPGGVEPPPIAELLPDPDELEDLLARQLGGSALFASRFREAAARALLLPRRYPGQRAALWQQRRRASDLLRAAARFPSFPIVLEAYRECLRDVFDVPALKELLLDLRRRRVRLVEVHTQRPSPFAAALLFGYAANFLYEGDAPLQERRAQALLVDPQRLRELIGSAELRELLDEDALLQLEQQLQHLAPERRARHLDGAHDLLLRLGDLSEAELAARCEPGRAPAWIAQLKQERRAVALTIAGEARLIAAEDAGRYRDALGIPPPPGLPAAFLEPTADPLTDLVQRYGRSHGPFTEEELAGRLGLPVGALRAPLAALKKGGRLIEGAFRPGGTSLELCDGEVLQRLRQRSLARLRREVEPVEGPALGRLYLAWQGIGAGRRGAEALLEVIEQLQGVSLPASTLEAEVLPSRLGRYEPHDLDRLLASGSVLWVGTESLGEHDGRVRLYLAEHAPLLLPGGPGLAEAGPLHEKLRAHLRARGASFFPQLLSACGGAFSQAVLDALWDLVWAGEVTNDTAQPLRAYLQPQRGRSGRGAARPGRGGLGGRMGAHLPVPREASGRWALVESFLPAQPPSSTERAQALARQLLARHGVLTREALAIEDVPGGFSAIYPVLRALEESGQLRRGYFVAGRGAAQFALPGATERLRLLRDPEEQPQAAIIAAVDPANPYGAALPWPEGAAGREGRRPQRAAGALVVLVDGAPAAWIARSEQQLLTYLGEVPEREPADVAHAIARALGALVDGGRRRLLLLKEVDGRPVAASVLSEALLAAGFQPGAQGYMRRPEQPPPAGAPMGGALARGRALRGDRALTGDGE